jgi:hypothetical protein
MLIHNHGLSRILALLTLTLGVALGGCVELDDSEPSPTSEADQEVATPAPMCPDIHTEFHDVPQGCITTDGVLGTKRCDIIGTTHQRWGAELLHPKCVMTSSEVTTTCGPCKPGVGL